MSDDIESYKHVPLRSERVQYIRKDAHDAQITKLAEERDRWKSGAEYMERERDRIRRDCRFAYDALDHDGAGYWAYEEGEENHLETLVAPVLIRAERLKRFEESETRAESLQAKLAEAVGLLGECRTDYEKVAGTLEAGFSRDVFDGKARVIQAFLETLAEKVGRDGE